MRPSLKPYLTHVIFVAAYVLLNWASNAWSIKGLNIAPWNPEIAIGLVYWLRYGKAAALPWFIALMLGEGLVRQFPAGLPMSVFISAWLTIGYGLTGEMLRRNFSIEEIFDNRQRLSIWILIVLIGTLINGAIFISLLNLAGLIPVGNGSAYLLRFWAGDLIGILVQMPLVWLLSSPQGRLRLRVAMLQWETLGIVLLAAVSLWVIFWLAASTDFRHFYFLYLPIIWAATRQGLAGASYMVLLQQIAVIAVMEWRDIGDFDAFQLQLRGVILACVGFFIGIVVDELKLVTHELKQTMRLAAAGEMAAALAHELNQPMTALSAYGKACELLLTRGETGKLLGESIHRMVLESGRAADIVGRLRDFFITGSTQLKPVAAKDIVSGISDRFLQQTADNDVAFEIGPVPVVTVLADRVQIEIVLRNLLANALDAVLLQPPGKRSIRLRMTVMGNDRLQLAVEDSGPGISTIKLSRLFEPFVSTKSSGMGLGLVISRSIIEAHGGNLWAEAGDHGIFVFTLQLAETGGGVMKTELGVFIVDDDPSVRDALGLLLSVQGYRTAVFASGEDFIKAWRPEWAGCLLIDLRMPGMDGLSLQKKLIEMNCHLPVIIITGHGDVTQAREAFKSQAFDFLEKPLDDVKLVNAINEAFIRQSTVRQQQRRIEQTQQSLKSLTPREREVMELVVSGQHNRDIAVLLDISVRTVEVHKARLMTKLEVSNVADLVRISMQK